MAQSVVHQVVQVLAPGCVPLFLTDGFTEYATALLTQMAKEFPGRDLTVIHDLESSCPQRGERRRSTEESL